MWGEFLVDNHSGYFSLTDTPCVFQKLDAWIRRSLRMIMWKQWKKTKTKIRNLIRIGLPRHKAYEWGNSRKAYWRISKSPILHKTLGNSYWNHQGLKSLYGKYCERLHLFDWTAVRIRTYCGVRGRGLITPSYSIINECRKAKIYGTDSFRWFHPIKILKTNYPLEYPKINWHQII